MSSMTIEQLKERKIKAEKEMATALKEIIEAFEAYTGLQVDDIQVEARRGYAIGVRKPTLLTLNTSIFFNL